MKNNFRLIILLSAFAILLSGAVSAGAAESIKNPTLKDLQGHWQGNTSWERGSTTTVNMRIKGDTASYSTEKGAYVGKITIKGEEITISPPSGRRTDTCKLSKDKDTLALKCDVDQQAAPQANITRAMRGTMRLEKDK